MMVSYTSLLVYNTTSNRVCQSELVIRDSYARLISLQALSAGAFFSIQAIAALREVSTTLYWPCETFSTLYLFMQVFISKISLTSQRGLCYYKYM